MRLNHKKGKLTMEKELKYKLLSESDYNKLRDYLDNKTSGTILHQKNYYYDTEEMLLLKHNAILRARIENERAIITFKQQKGKKQGYFISDEIENNVSLEDINRVFSGKIPIIQLCGDNRENVEKLLENKELNLTGTFENKRIVYYIDDIKLELDKINYGNSVVDYEIETESEDEKKVREYLDTLLQSLSVRYQLQDKTKYRRFLEARNISPPV